MPEPHPLTGTSRRSLMRMAAVGSAAAGLSAIAVTSAQAESASLFPADFSYPEVTGPSLALWGSSSFDDARVTENVPSGLDARLDVRLNAYLGVPVLKFGRGGESSTNIAARRGVAGYETVLGFSKDIIPASSEPITVKLTNPKIAWNNATYFPGFIQDIPGVISSLGNSEGYYTFTRSQEGKARYAPHETGAADFVSQQYLVSKSSHHVIQIGRNNLNLQDLIRKNTQQCFDMAPKKSLVMGHFRYKDDASDSDRAKQVISYNAWAAKTFGDKFIDPEKWIIENTQQTWLRYGDLSGSGVWDKKTDAEDAKNGKIPRTLYASDGIHLNGWGYLALSRMLEAKINELGWFV